MIGTIVKCNQDDYVMLVKQKYDDTVNVIQNSD